MPRKQGKVQRDLERQAREKPAAPDLFRLLVEGEITIDEYIKGLDDRVRVEREEAA